MLSKLASGWIGTSESDAHGTSESELVEFRFKPGVHVDLSDFDDSDVSPVVRMAVLMQRLTTFENPIVSVEVLRDGLIFGHDAHDEPRGMIVTIVKFPLARGALFRRHFKQLLSGARVAIFQGLWCDFVTMEVPCMVTDALIPTIVDEQVFLAMGRKDATDVPSSYLANMCSYCHKKNAKMQCTACR